MPEPVPFNRRTIVGREREYALQALEAGSIAGDGEFGRRCEALLAELLGAPRVLLTTSGTAALEMAALLLDLAPGDEVIVPSFTFPSTANAFVLRGARPVFIDIRRDSLNLDETLLASKITPRTRAIVPVHYAGVGCEMDAILEIASAHGIPVVEDNALGLFGAYKGCALGTMGRFGVLSFHATKNITSGEGGALIVNDERYVARAEVVREKGTDRRSYERGQVDKYSWVDVGSSYVLSDLLAAVLLAQLEARELVQAECRRLWHLYMEGLSDWAAASGVLLPQVPEHCQPSYHLFHLFHPSEQQRDAFIDHMQRQGIQTASHYQPLHLSQMGRRLGAKEADCPVTADVSRRLVRLPLHLDMGGQVERVIDAVRSFF